MSKSMLFPALLILAITAASAIYTYVRAESLTSTDQVVAKGLNAASKDTAAFYAVIGVVVGVIGVFVFRAMVNAAPQTAQNNFLLLALGIAVALEILAAVVFKMKGIVDFTVLHVLYLAAYGWLLPQLILA